MPPDEEIKNIEVDQPVIEKGSLQFGNRSGFKYAAPNKMKVAFKAVNYFAAGAVTLVGATDLFSGTQAKVISFILGVTVLACGAIESATGVKPAEDK